MKRIIVLTSGGDAPGMNAAIRAVVRTGNFHGLEVFGCLSGYKGLLEKTLIPLNPASVANCIQDGGTILKADRCEAFYQKENRDTCRAFLKEQQIDGLIVIGGNGTFRGASLLSAEGGNDLAVIGIPGTIDNDINGTEYTIGFDTARNTALQAIDKIRDTASSHNRNFLVEVMGRKSGFLAVDVGIAGGAEFILIPEYEISSETLAHKLLQQRRSKLSSIIVVAEANQPGRSVNIAEELTKLTHQSFRVCILGHTQRGGAPTTMDRVIASQMGYFAVEGLLHGQTHKMVAMQHNQFSYIPFPAIEASTRTFSSQELLKINEVLCI